MKILLLILFGYAILFYLLKKTGIDDEPGETLMMFGELAPFLILGVEFVNWVFGTDFSSDAWAFIWLGLFAIWTALAIWALIDEPRQRRKQEEKLRRILSGEEF
jgi:hypothetical protein